MKNKMNTKEKAQELVDKFKDYVHGYVGSSMLTNHEYPEQILAQAKKASIIAVDEILKNFEGMTGNDMVAYWEDVKIQILNEAENPALQQGDVSGWRCEVTLRLNNGSIATFITYMIEKNYEKAQELAKNQNWLSGVKEIIHTDLSTCRYGLGL